MQTPGAAAARARDLKTHLAAHLGHLSRSAARRTNFFVAGLYSRAMAHAARVQTRDAQLLHRAAHRFRESDLDLKFQIAARLAVVGPPRRRPSAENLAGKNPE